MKKKFVNNYLFMILLVICLLVSCKTEKDFFPIHIDDVEGISLIPVDGKGLYSTISSIHQISDLIVKTEILEFLNNKQKYNSFGRKSNDITFVMIVEVNGKSQKYPIYYNTDIKRTRIKLFSNGYNGHRIGYYSIPGLYEYLDKIFDFEIIHHD